MYCACRGAKCLWKYMKYTKTFPKIQILAQIAKLFLFTFHFLHSVLASSVRLFSPASPGYAFFMASMNPSSVLLSARAFFIVVR